MTASPSRGRVSSHSHLPPPSPGGRTDSDPERRRTIASALAAESLRAGRLALSLRTVLEHLPAFDRYRNEGSRILFWASDIYATVNAEAWTTLEHFEAPTAATLTAFIRPEPHNVSTRPRPLPKSLRCSGPLLRQLRLSRGLSVPAAVRLARVDRKSWYGWERTPSFRLYRATLEKICLALHAPTHALLAPPA